MSETSSLIDEKKNQQINEKEQEKNVDWIGFFKATLVNMIYVIIWAMLGSNLVYFLHSDLDALFPDNRNMPPYSNPKESLKTRFIEMLGMQKAGMQKGGKYRKENNICVSDYKNNEITPGLISLRQKLGMNELSTPYSGITNESGIKALFSNLFGSSARYSYIMGRRLIKTFFKMLRLESGWGETILFLLIPFFIFIMVFQVPFFFGLFTTIWGEITSSSFGWLWTFWFSFLFGLPFIWAALVGVSQSINFFMTILFLPIFADFGKVKEILGCNTHLFNGLFCLLTISSAFTHLDGLLASIITVVMFFLWYMRK
jgi:hypothetical protein